MHEVLFRQFSSGGFVGFDVFTTKTSEFYQKIADIYKLTYNKDPETNTIIGNCMCTILKEKKEGYQLFAKHHIVAPCKSISISESDEIRCLLLFHHTCSATANDFIELSKARKDFVLNLVANPNIFTISDLYLFLAFLCSELEAQTSGMVSIKTQLTPTIVFRFFSNSIFSSCPIEVDKLLAEKAKGPFAQFATDAALTKLKTCKWWESNFTNVAKILVPLLSPQQIKELVSSQTDKTYITTLRSACPDIEIPTSCIIQ